MRYVLGRSVAMMDRFHDGPTQRLSCSCQITKLGSLLIGTDSAQIKDDRKHPLNNRKDRFRRQEEEHRKKQII